MVLSEEQIKNISTAGVNAIIKELREAGADELDLTMVAMILTYIIAERISEVFS